VILVTVGLHDVPFERLIRAADGMAALTCEPVLIQRGVAHYVPAHAAWFDAVPAGQMEALIAQARVLVSHAGAGSILAAHRARLPLVLVPRLCRLGEAIDDHQLQLAEALAARKRAVVLGDPSPHALLGAVERAAWVPDRGAATGLHEALRSWLAEPPARPSRRWWVHGRRG
jgi:beta-1,4-N-acetylglucosaminyltransferase